jgi:methylated-DNA-[protein]-cysteine S-methyltransferase
MPRVNGPSLRRLDSVAAQRCHPNLRDAQDATGLPQLSLHTPVGDITVSEEDERIVALDWGWGRDQTETPLLRRARDQLHAYFDGESLAFDLPLAPQGTPYRLRVWSALRTIPPGQTRTYQEIARAAGGSARSVGGANGANPIPILIPCHRVVAAGGIGGYSGGDGTPTKRYLLDLETSRPGHSGRLPGTNEPPRR